MNFIVNKTGFYIVLFCSVFSVLFGYQNCGKVKFNRQEKIVSCTDSEILAGTCGIACSWAGDKNISTNPTSLSGMGSVSGVVRFTVPQNPEIQSVIIDFGDGSAPVTVTGDNQTVEHTYSANQTTQYTATFTVRKVPTDEQPNCVSSQQQVITLNTSDTCLISTDLSGPSNGVVNEELGFTVNMTNCPNNGYTIQWDKDFNLNQVVDLTTTNNPTADFSYSTPGTYTVRAQTVFGSLGINAVSQRQVIISCPAGAYQSSSRICICHSTGEAVPDTGICPPCGLGATQDPSTGACICPAGQAYDPVDRRCECPSGNVPVGGVCESQLSCTINVNGTNITRNHGEVLTLHRRENDVTCNFTCSSQSRTCRNGQFVNSANVAEPFPSGYNFTTPQACQAVCGNCSLLVADGTLTANQGQTRTVYTRTNSNVSCGFACGSQVLTCNGTQFLNSSSQPVTSGSQFYMNQTSCTSECQRCNVTGYPGITQLSVGQSLTKYSRTGVACGAAACASQTLTCNSPGQNLSFNSDFTFTNATECRSGIPACPVSCTVTGYPNVTTLAPGQTLNGYTASGVACNGSCSLVSRSCPASGGVALNFPSGTTASQSSCNAQVPVCPPVEYPPQVIYSKTFNGPAETNFTTSDKIFGRLVNLNPSSVGCSTADMEDPSHPGQDVNLTACDVNSSYTSISQYKYRDGTSHWYYEGSSVWRTTSHNDNNLYGHELFLPARIKTCVKKDVNSNAVCTTINISAPEPRVIVSKTSNGPHCDPSAGCTFNYATDSFFVRMENLAPFVRDSFGRENTKGCTAVLGNPPRAGDDLNYCNVSSPTAAYTNSRYLSLPKSDWTCSNGGVCNYLGLRKKNGEAGFTSVLSQNATAVPGQYRICGYNKQANKLSCVNATISGQMTQVCPGGQVPVNGVCPAPPVEPDRIDVYASTSSADFRFSGSVPAGPFVYTRPTEFFSYVRLPSNVNSYRICLETTSSSCVNDAQFSTVNVNSGQYVVQTQGNTKVVQSRNAANVYNVGTYRLVLKNGTATTALNLQITQPPSQANGRWCPMNMEQRCVTNSINPEAPCTPPGFGFVNHPMCHTNPNGLLGKQYKCVPVDQPCPPET